MRQDLKEGDYYFMFQTSGVPFLFSDLCIRHYLPFDGVIFQRNNQYKQFIHNNYKASAQKRYEELYKDERSVEAFSQKFEDARRAALEWGKELAGISQLTLENFDTGLRLFAESEASYAVVDPIYTDLLFEDKTRDTQTLQNLVLEKKNVMRSEINDVFFTDNSPYLLFQKKLSEQTGVPFKDLSYLPITNVRGLLTGKPFVNLYNGNLDYVVIKEGETYSYLFGAEATAFIAKFEETADTEAREVQGISVSKKGIYRGPVKRAIVDYEDFEGSLKRMDASGEGYVLVADATIPELVPMMKRAVAIVTNVGGLLSHAAITSRELGIPCIVGTKIAAEIFKDGEMVEVDADSGVVRKI